MIKYDNLIPSRKWEELNEIERNFFRNLKEEDLKYRWKSERGKHIKEQIINNNLNYKKSSTYLDFVGTVKTDWGNKIPKLDLRGINFSGYENIINDEMFSFDFSDCSLNYSDFSNAELSGSSFKNSDILYSDFLGSILDECDFSYCNLTLTNFSKSTLRSANFKNSWMSNVDFSNAKLSFIKFNNKTDFQDIDLGKLDGVSDYHFSRYLVRKSNMYYFREQSIGKKILYYVWKWSCDFGNSFLRWLIFSLIIIIGFGYIYSINAESFQLNREVTALTYYYYSTVTFTSLGYRDMYPIDIIGELLTSFQVIVGYIMLGGLISIMSNKIIFRE